MTVTVFVMKKVVILLGVAGCAAVLGAYRFWGSGPVAEVYVAKRGTAIAAVYGTVKVVPNFTINVHARNSGVVELSDFLMARQSGIGIPVSRGQVLANLVNQDLDRELSKARTDVDAAEERHSLGPPSLPELKTQEAQLARLEKLASLNNVAASEVERVRNQAQTLKERVKGEELELDRTVSILRQQLMILEDRKERCVIRSPIDGVITALNVANGEFIFENSTPFTVATAATYLEAQINEEDVGRIRGDMKAAVKLYSYSDREFTATVRQVVPAASDQRYTVNLTLDDPPDNLMSGMTGELNVITGQRPDALIIPARALLVDKVFVVGDGVVKPRAVKVGYRSIERAEILEGLREGEQVVVADQDLLRPGQRVRAITVNM